MEQNNTFSNDHNLDSTTGYCMPFKGNDKVTVLTSYGEQTDGRDFCHGMVFQTNNDMLSAVADGKVSAIGNDASLGLCLTIQYGRYEVCYGYLSQVYANFGQQVGARRKVAVATDRLYLSVRFDGTEMDPLDFIRMLYGNVVAWSQDREPEPEAGVLDLDIHTRYDNDRKQIEDWMTRFYANYFMAVITRRYVPAQSMTQSLLNIFRSAPDKGYFYEDIPSGINPLGLGQRSIPLIEKVQNLLIGDFLNYMALQHGMYLPGMGDDVKKK